MMNDDLRVITVNSVLKVTDKQINSKTTILQI